MEPSFKIASTRFLRGLGDLAKIGEIAGGGVCRIALTDDDCAGRDWVKSRMSQLGMSIRTDALGNVIGRYEGQDSARAAIMIGSHIDTVQTGGRYDGNLGVLAGLELVAALQEANHRPLRSIEVGFFTNEEGCRFPPDMMGSLVYTGELSLQEALSKTDAGGISVEAELTRLGLKGSAPVPGPVPYAFIELHIEQGPILDAENIKIGVVTAVQGISWQKLMLTGQSNHAGTTPMSMRKDAGLAAARIITAVRELVTDLGGDVVGTVGHLTLAPNLINVVPHHVELTVDLRSPIDAQLSEAEKRLSSIAQDICDVEGVSLSREQLVRLAPAHFAPEIIDVIEAGAKSLGISSRRMVSGAGHDAQVIGAIAPTGMIFVPSIGGISHNPAEDTLDDDLVAGAQLLLTTVVDLANRSDSL
jgi:beta-ureidopropionase / N-carbamoyl-L-amino-acid hydrolase